MTINHFEDLEIWQDARELCKDIKIVTDGELFSRDFKFRDQIRSSSGSVMDCIAEGFERDGSKEFIQFLSIAKGSCGEARSQSYRAYDYDYIDQVQLDDLLDKTRRLSGKIGNFIQYLKGSGYKGSKYK